MLKLFQFPPRWNLPNASPFCLKLETYLRMANLPYETKYLVDIRKTPKGKLPYIEDDGIKIADSSLIINYLQQKYNVTLDDHLTPEQKAIAVSLQRLFEDHLYWCVVYSRWIDPVNWPAVKKDFFGKLPKILYLFLPDLIRKKTKSTLYAQGLGRHSHDEIMQFGVKDLQAVATILGDKPFIFGDQPSSIDAVAFGCLVAIIVPPVKSALQDYAKSVPQLVSYCDRMRKQYFP